MNAYTTTMPGSAKSMMVESGGNDARRLVPRRAVSTRPNASTGIPGKAETKDMSEDEKIVALLPLLHQIAGKMRPHLAPNVEFDDLVGAGSLGLIDAVRKFDARRTVKIESYAQHRIRGAILDSLRASDDAPRSLRGKNKKAEKSYHDLQAKLGRPPTNEEMAQDQTMSLEKWYENVRELQAMGVEWLHPAEPNPQQYLDEESVPSKDAPDQFELCYLSEKRAIINRGLAELPRRERMIMQLYYAREYTMKQIGASLNLHESRVCQLHAFALQQLRSVAEPLLQPRCVEAAQ